MPFYTLEERREIQEKWSARLDDWKKSGISGMAWCKQEKTPYHQFNYWKKRLLNHKQPKFDTQSFVELDDDSDTSGVEVVLNEISIRLSRDFDSTTLLRCLRTLKEAKC
jgi:hypothetical protein